MSRRFQGAESSEILGQSGVLNQDMIQVRHSVGTANDSDKGLPLSVIQSCPVATCETAGSTVAKVGTVANFPDFTLLNGREVLVYFASGNTATSPTFNLNNTGAYPLALENQASSVNIGSGSWGDGVFLHLKFVDITISGTQIQKWVICGHNIAQQTSDYTIYADGETRYINAYTTNTETPLNKWYNGKRVYSKVFTWSGDGTSDMGEWFDNANMVTPVAIYGFVMGGFSLPIPYSYESVVVDALIDRNSRKILLRTTGVNPTYAYMVVEYTTD